MHQRLIAHNNHRSRHGVPLVGQARMRLSNQQGRQVDNTVLVTKAQKVSYLGVITPKRWASPTATWTAKPQKNQRADV